MLCDVLISIAQFCGAYTQDINVRPRRVKRPEYSKIVLDDTKEIFLCQYLGADDYNSIIKRGTATQLKTFILEKCNAPAAHLQRGNWSVQT